MTATTLHITRTKDYDDIWNISNLDAFQGLDEEALHITIGNQAYVVSRAQAFELAVALSTLANLDFEDEEDK